MSKTIVATFETPADAAACIEELLVAGIDQEQLSLLVSEHGPKKRLVIERSSKATEGATAGAVTGGVAGALFAGLTAAGVLVVPGGLAVAGPLVAALAGAGVGGAAGTVVGALVGAGFTEHQARLVEGSVERGNIALTITPIDPATLERASEIVEASARLDSSVQ